VAQASDQRGRSRELLRRLLPPKARAGVRSILAAADPIRVARYRRDTHDRRPVPPPLLRERVGASSIESYFETGRRYAEAVEDGLREAGRSWVDCDEVLDFGCGAGKVLQSLPQSRAKLHGTDIHGASIEWMRKALPGMDARVNAFAPPLPFPAEHFDLIYAWSVFSHLNAASQDAWLPELVRILRPGGTLLISILGEKSHRAAERRARGLDLAEVVAQGFMFVPYEGSSDSYGEFGAPNAEYGLAFLSRAYVQETWSAVAKVRGILPLGLDAVQDIVVLERPHS
jgi:SAM-dependent methyltransferase